MSFKTVFDFKPRIERLPTTGNPVSYRCSALANRDAAIEDLKNMYRLNHMRETADEYNGLCWSDRVGIARSGLGFDRAISDIACELLDIVTGPFKAVFHGGCAAYFTIQSKLNKI